MNRRQALVGAVSVLGGVNMLAAACGRAAARPHYHWHKGAMAGGGYCNAMATDPLRSGHAAAAGDVWGEFATDTAGALWFPTMIGATSIGAIYGRAAAYSKRVPGLRYFGIGVLESLDPGQGYLGAVWTAVAAAPAPKREDLVLEQPARRERPPSAAGGRKPDRGRL